MSLNLKGLDKLEKQLTNLAKTSKSQEFSFDEVFTKQFMVKNTSFENIHDFLLASPEHISTPEEFDNSDETILDNFVSEQTKFNSWEEMLGTGVEELFAKKLGF
ncbi:hypothetical protein [Streptococcus sp. zg-JUN1979]|uniref:hypothetical protein n=1 Tax=Streptococcus sp. zg-JUN1979 TaxID=3391450 RepID=UPI0039A5C413